jgi:hypothetical protein
MTPLNLQKTQSTATYFNPIFNSDGLDSKDLNRSAIEKRFNRLTQLSEEENEAGNPEE